ncbi:spore protease YyaC [Natranaerofaba carboxydovora]|uniref:spore protease YyaC n=1 Tax=Natranaerofaba carboxydovora TaxID=2742683 RepID=UPI001F13A24B|nr:spore protease YyaC [Natranaerofaba carboxydovora]UMZ75173.1 hypothetical protein ACONDI_02788 [Natranaerofaba carboxydovora]
MKNFLPSFNYTKKNKVTVNTPLAQSKIAKHLLHILFRNNMYKKDLIILCIGTDRSTGDSLGPLVGSRLMNHLSPEVGVYGSLANPVHAVNLKSKLEYVESNYYNPFIIAVDACLGKSKNVGKINIEPGPLKPGTGVNKSLPEVGNCHITGVVNVGGFMEYLVLQNTRLSTVFQLSITISKGIILAINYLKSHEYLKNKQVK